MAVDAKMRAPLVVIPFIEKSNEALVVDMGDLYVQNQLEAHQTGSSVLVEKYAVKLSHMQVSR